jgi:hypothetical protein
MKNSLTELLRPHAVAIMSDVAAGNREAQQVIDSTSFTVTARATPERLPCGERRSTTGGGPRNETPAPWSRSRSLSPES